MEQSLTPLHVSGYSKSVAGLLFACLTAVAVPVASAQSSVPTQINQSFNSYTLPSDWEAAYYSNPAEPPAGGLAAVGVGGGKIMLRLRRTTGSGGSPSQNLTYYYTGNEGSVQNGVLHNFTSSLTVRTEQTPTQTSSLQGVMVGAQSVSYDVEGFYVAYDLNQLYIYSNPSRHDDSGEELARANFTSTIAASVDYSLRIEVNGETLTASMWTIGGTPTQLASVSHTADAAISGLFGLRSSIGNPGLQTYFGDVEITAYAPIPEAGTTATVLGALVLGSVVVARRCIRR